MKKLNRIVVATAGLLLAPLSLAAFVQTHTPDGINPSSYTLLPGGTPEAVYSNMVSGDHSALVTDEDNGGHELVYLGLRTPFEITAGGDVAPSDQVTVNLNNIGGGTTGSVSLVLSAGEAVDWIINVGAGVQLENIFLFSPNAVDRANTTTDITGSDVIATISPANVCGYELPSTGSCLIEDILGIPDEFGFSFNNFLGDLTEDNLGVTNFNGTYYVSQFDVNIDSVVVPLPAAGGLFAAALALLQIHARRKTIRLS